LRRDLRGERSIALQQSQPSLPRDSGSSRGSGCKHKICGSPSSAPLQKLPGGRTRSNRFNRDFIYPEGNAEIFCADVTPNGLRSIGQQHSIARRVELFSRNLQLDYNGPIGTTHFSPSEDDDMRGERVSRMKSGESYPKQSPGPS